MLLRWQSFVELRSADAARAEADLRTLRQQKGTLPALQTPMASPRGLAGRSIDDRTGAAALRRRASLSALADAPRAPRAAPARAAPARATVAKLPRPSLATVKVRGGAASRRSLGDRAPGPLSLYGGSMAARGLSARMAISRSPDAAAADSDDEFDAATGAAFPPQMARRGSFGDRAASFAKLSTAI
ncbi:hypothetical protein M885DRAFT_512281 [Pelagophyceae sp. CCMP2097]|nr:hypothetical protein M885DRAFT_512281 [Pelagophyceae sp. CCMP2097]